MSNSITVDFSPVTNRLDQMSRQLSEGIDNVGVQVGQARADIALTSSELAELRAEFEAFRSEAERTGNVQRSETKVGTLRDELDRLFGHYAQVRRASVGTLQAYDVGNVSNATVTTLAEELMIQTPRYWLAPALVTLAAWSRDNSSMAERSVREAYARDQNKCSLFFALVLRRQGRQQGALVWLRHYITSLDPTHLTREFAVILEASSYGAFGPEGQRLLTRTIDGWVSQLRQSSHVIDEQIQRWGAEIGTQRDQLGSADYPALRAIAPGFDAVQRQIESASALPRVIEKYDLIRRHDVALPTHLEGLLDDILDQLVTDYDEEELPLRREVAYHEAVIAEHGDLDRAAKRASLVQEALEETSDAVTLQTMAAISPEYLGVSVQTQRIAIGVAQGDFRSAVGRYCAAYRGAALRDLGYQLGPAHSNYAQTYGFTGCQLGSNWPENTAVEAIAAAWNATFQPRLDALRFKPTWYVKPGLIALAVIVVLLLINQIVGIIALLIGGGAVFLLGQKEQGRLAAQVKALQDVRREAIANSTALYRDANAELVDALLLYDEVDGHEHDLLRLIDTWPTATPGSTTKDSAA